MKSSRWMAAGVVLLLAVVMFATEPMFSVIDDEVAMVSTAIPSPRELWNKVAEGAHHPHPPLHSILLHYWLGWTDGRLELLRLPAILVFAAGLWFCCLAAEQIAGRDAVIPTALAGALWPFGFHLGRVQGWYGLAFFLVALTTYAYLRLLNSMNWRNWAMLFASGALLLYTNYYGWVLLACLAGHFAWTHRSAGMWLRAAGTMTLWLLVFSPILKGFLSAYLVTPPTGETTARTKLMFGVYNAYALFAGESIAPWFLPLSIPIALALAGVVLLTLRHSPGKSRFLFAAMLALMLMLTLQGIISTKRTILLGPWLVIPVGVALAAAKGSRSGQLLAACCATVVLLAGYGIAQPHHYAATRYIEPWRTVAAREATHVRQGALVLAMNPSFCFYLTHELKLPPANPHWKFAGTVPWNFRHPQIMDADQWVRAGQPRYSRVRFVKGASRDDIKPANEFAERWLNQNCRLAEVQRELQDRGFQWKQRFYPTWGQMQWRVEVRGYECQ